MRSGQALLELLNQVADPDRIRLTMAMTHNWICSAGRIDLNRGPNQPRPNAHRRDLRDGNALFIGTDEARFDARHALGSYFDSKWKPEVSSGPAAGLKDVPCFRHGVHTVSEPMAAGWCRDSSLPCRHLAGEKSALNTANRGSGIEPDHFSPWGEIIVRKCFFAPHTETAAADQDGCITFSNWVIEFDFLQRLDRVESILEPFACRPEFNADRTRLD